MERSLRRMKTQKISLSQAVPGMVSASELYSKDGLLLIGSDTILTDKIITRLEFYSVTELCIYIITSLEDASRILDYDSYYERLKEQESFKAFQRAYQQAITSVKASFDDIVIQKKNPDRDHLLADISKIICQTSSCMEIFNMMHCIHNFDDNTFVHSLNVAIICSIIGRWLQFTPEELEIITLCGLLHDIGKLLVPSEIIQKPSKLTSEEYSTMQTHPLLGFEILRNQNLDYRIKNVALLHHERCDGSGYPYRYKGDQIDTFTKLVSIADVYDAMVSPRVYRGPLCPFEVMSIFEAEGYKKYDPKFLLTFMQGIADSYIQSKVRLSNDMIGEVVLINYSELSRPVVKVNDQFINLSKQRDLSITALI